MMTLPVQICSVAPVPARLAAPSSGTSAGPLDRFVPSTGSSQGGGITRLCIGLGVAGGAAGLGFSTASLTGATASLAGSINGSLAFMAIGAVSGGLLASAMFKGKGVLTGAIAGGTIGGVGGAFLGLRVGAAFGNVLGFAAGGVVGGAAGWALGRAIERLLR